MFALLANLLLSKIISWLTLRFFTVFYSLCRTAGDTSHTVSTILPPDRPAAFKMDIIQRAACFTLSASSIFFCYSKTFSVDHHGIHQRIEHLGHDCFTRLLLRQPLLVTNGLCNLYNLGSACCKILSLTSFDCVPRLLYIPVASQPIEIRAKKSFFSA